MKFSLWLERKQKRNQESATKMPDILTKKELQKRVSLSKIHNMVGQGNQKTHGKAGSSDSPKDKESLRSKSKQRFNKQLKYGDSW